MPAHPVGRGLGRSFWQLFVSSTTSNLADGIGRATLPLLATSLTLRVPGMSSAQVTAVLVAG